MRIKVVAPFLAAAIVVAPGTVAAEDFLAFYCVYFFAADRAATGTTIAEGRQNCDEEALTASYAHGVFRPLNAADDPNWEQPCESIAGAVFKPYVCLGVPSQ